MRLKLSLRKILSVIATSALLLNAVAPYSIAIAQSITPSPTPTATDQPTATPADTTTPAPTDTPVDTVTPTPDVTATPTDSASVTPTPTETPTITPVETSTPVPIVTSSPTAESSATPASTPLVTTDKADYYPGETATITGQFFQALQNLVVKIFGGSTSDGTYTESYFNILTDSFGGFSFGYLLDSISRPLYTAQVYDATGTQLAQTTFTDPPAPKPSVKLEQCQNGGTSDAGPLPCSGSNWVTGNVNGTKAHWAEGDFLPYRATVSDLFAGDNTVTFSFDTAKSSELKHAIDYVSSYDLTETLGAATATHANAIDPCGDVFPCTPSTPVSSVAIVNPSGLSTAYPPSCAGSTWVGIPTAGSIKGWSSIAGHLTSISVAYLDVPDGVADGTDCPAKFKITFHVTNDHDTVVFAWGGHVAANLNPGSGGYWGAGNSVPTGSPYHMHAGFDQESPIGTFFSVGSQDRSLASSAIVQKATLTLLKTVVNDNGGTAVDTAWTLAASGPTSISGVEGNAAVTNAPVDAGTYALSESGGPSNYTASLYRCAVNGGAPVVSNSLTLTPSDVATCTITNDDNAPQLHLRKTVTNDNGGNRIKYSLDFDSNRYSSEPDKSFRIHTG